MNRAGAPALPPEFSRSIAIAQLRVRMSLAGRSSSMTRFMERLPGAMIIANRFPMLPKHPRRTKAERYISQIPREKIVCRLGENAAADRFTESDVEPWITPSARVNSAARGLYSKIAAKLGGADEQRT